MDNEFEEDEFVNQNNVVRCEPEGQYQSLYDRRLLGAQGYGASRSSQNNQPYPVQQVAVAERASTVRNEPHVRQWVLQVDPNPNPEDEQHLDDSVDASADVIAFESASNNDVIDPDLIPREPTQGADEDSSDEAALVVPQNAQMDSRDALAVGVRPNQPNATASLQLETKPEESEQTESYLESQRSAGSTPRGPVSATAATAAAVAGVSAATAAGASASGPRSAEGQHKATNRSVSAQHSRAESDCSQASFKSGSRLSCQSRQDTEGGDAPVGTPAASASTTQPKRLNPQGTTTKDADVKPIVKPKQLPLNTQKRKQPPPQAQARSKAHAQCLQPTGALQGASAGRTSTQSRLPAPTRRNTPLPRERVDAREQPAGRDPKPPATGLVGAPKQAMSASSRKDPVHAISPRNDSRGTIM